MKKKRGRKTAGALEAVESIPVRPDPPLELDERQTEIWLEVTSGLPVEWFGEETFALLTAYCIHMGRFRSFSLAADNLLAEGALAPSVNMAKAAEVESRAAMSAATKLRITKQSTVRAEKQKPAGQAAAPWPMLNS